MVGCGRSGTSLLATILSSHPDIAVFPSEANDLWHPSLYPWHSSQGKVAPIWVDPQRFTNHSLERIDWAQLRGIFGAFQFLTRRPIFLNKSVMLSFMLEEVAGHFESGRFIHMHRDGRAVALSYAKKILPKIQEHPEAYIASGITPDFEPLVYRCFDHWIDHIYAVERADRVLGLKRSGRLLEFSYEAFSREPERFLATVLDFIGISDNGNAFAPRTRIENRNYKMSSELPAGILDKLGDRGALTLERKGY
jgi:hypothetical protein